MFNKIKITFHCNVVMLNIVFTDCWLFHSTTTTMSYNG